MILAAIDWLGISINVLLLVFVIVCLVMTLLILMQRPKQEGLGAAFGGGVTDQVFGARTTGVLQKGTIFMATMFFLLSLALAVLIGVQNRDVTLVTAEMPEATTAEEPPAVTEPITPVPPPSLVNDLAPEPEPDQVPEPVEETPEPVEQTPEPMDEAPPVEAEPTPEPEETPVDDETPDQDETPAEDPVEEP